ncbi:hypothetical protein [Mariniphaga sediminis]|uniref:hypothetical protein n=1 Tax=Mariniphaga sediminis TaxID=1628158 RepID=UPI00356429A9
MHIKLKTGFWVFTLLFLGNRALAQLSPGELSHAHAHLEGLANCTQCHILGEKETTSKCLACHKEIQSLVLQNNGYHASAEVKGKECAQCHGEHFGRKFKVIRFDENSFDHNLTGYKLEGRHSKIECASCHNGELIQKSISQKKGNTFLGLGTECLSCHDDYHQNTLSANCLSCHNQDTFLPATGFDHQKTGFPLIGKHKLVDCAKCHAVEPINGKEFQRFAGVEFSNCTSCHQDVHRNKFGNDCRKCHNEFSFHEIKSLSAFNHNRTDFPLRGMHQAVNCKSCHSGSYTQPVAHNHCSDCHSDYHENQFQKNGASPDCAVCHSVNGFSPSSFGIERHNQSEFALEGAHLATPCFACHFQEEKWNFANPATDCIDCHENIHKNVLNEKYIPDNNCKNCHSTFSWDKISFDHSVTNFQLLGKHAQVTCRDCHFRETSGMINQKFAHLAESCENCHEDVHFNQFEVQEKNECQRCHTFNDWLPEKFNHDDTQFKLDGKHAGLACTQCHKTTGDLSRNFIVYKFEDISCASCH